MSKTYIGLCIKSSYMYPPDSQKIKNEKILKLTVNTDQVMLSGDIYYY